MFSFFRVIIIFFTLATMLLSIFALTGSYTNKAFLTNTYLLNINLSNLDLSKILKLDDFPKRDLESMVSNLAQIEISEPVAKRDIESLVNNINTASIATAVATALGTNLPTAVPTNLESLIPTAVPTALPSSIPTDLASALASALPSSIPTDGGILTTVQAVISDIIHNFSYEQLGLADVYTISYWGYCRGYSTTELTFDSKLNKYLKPFDSNKVNITWCSPAKAAYAFDPLTLIKTELNNTINDRINSLDGSPTIITATVKSELKVLLDNLNYENLGLPNGIELKLTLLNNLTKASFALLIVVCAFGFISIVIQCLAFCFSPSSCCLSFLNFFFQLLIFILALVAAALITGAYLFVRQKVNDETESFGVKTFLSINLYAFIWSGVVAALLVVIFSLLGYCCGCFGTGRRRYRKVQPEAAYEHHDLSFDSEK